MGNVGVRYLLRMLIAAEIVGIAIAGYAEWKS
jgi:hypothetical protein